MLVSTETLHLEYLDGKNIAVITVTILRTPTQ
jgi:hypothetical protein